MSVDCRRIAIEVLSNHHGCVAQFLEMVKAMTQNEVSKGIFLTVVGFFSYSDEIEHVNFPVNSNFAYCCDDTIHGARG